MDAGSNDWRGVNRRKHQRFPLKKEARYVVGGKRYTGQVGDISETGLCIRPVGEPLRLYSRLELEVAIPQFGLKTLDDTPAAFGRVVWTRASWAGIRFTRRPSRSVKALKKFIRQYFFVADVDDLRSFVDNLFREPSGEDDSFETTREVGSERDSPADEDDSIIH